MAELERQLAELRAGRAADSKELDEVLRQLGELSARALLGKDSDDAEG